MSAFWNVGLMAVMGDRILQYTADAKDPDFPLQTSKYEPRNFLKEISLICPYYQEISLIFCR